MVLLVAFDAAVPFHEAVVFDLAVALDAGELFLMDVITAVSVLLGLLRSTDPFVTSKVIGDCREPGKDSRSKKIF